ncbi:MAG: phenylalanine--tRNA ligase subunit alpha [Candidatus Sungbacteria bacterium]|nr:phenylalanine--tRNA ligase subunit alpha [Candidatus Sungbacteria bacterium]
MKNELAKIYANTADAITKAETPEKIEEIRIECLGRKGALTAILRALKDLTAEERKTIGEEANKIRQKIESRLREKKIELERTSRESILKKEWIDVTRPGKQIKKGTLHPITQLLREAESIFASMGFATIEGPEVETEYYNFDALNIPENHPARDMWDTFWLKKLDNSEDRLLLRTHTSPMQIRYMESHNPPIRIIVPGRVYRYEATDASHDIQFYQLEGLMVDKNISIANFKAIIRLFFSRLFEKEITIRLRPSFFPFTEPSFEVDISCIICGQKGCSVCKQSGWLELAGAGMVHPNVFKAAGYNPKEVQGFAFGMGVNRIAMMKYKIPDIRLFHSGDLRFLKQF